MCEYLYAGQQYVFFGLFHAPEARLQSQPVGPSLASLAGQQSSKTVVWAEILNLGHFGLSPSALNPWFEVFDEANHSFRSDIAWNQVVSNLISWKPLYNIGGPEETTQ